MSYRTWFARLAAIAVLTSLTTASVSVTPAEAQFGNRLKERLKKNAEDKAIEKAVDKENEAIDAATAGNAAEDTARATTEPTEPGSTTPPAAAAAEPAGATGAAPAADAAPAEATEPAALKPGEGAWANYDFKPGDQIIYADDFTSDEVGDFPRKMEFKSGALEIVEWNSSRWLQATNTSKFFVVLPQALPERFTMEFDYANPGGEVWISFGDENKRVQFGGSGTAAVYNQATGVSGSGSYGGEPDRNKVRRARVLGDGKYLKVYFDDQRILNVPNADLGRSTKILFYTDASTAKPALFGNFRIAAGGKKLYDALAEKGRVATQGIYFDSGSDRIKPESTPTLKEIGTMLKEHPELKLTIEGHTDNVGAASANLALSEKRAAAVRQQLINTYQIDGARLQAKGLGQTKAAASNDTPEGRQQNRRVELVKS
jgi:outer membrane protein OmpA-like peptidoglycan-associated protein